MRSVDNILEEIDELKTKYDIQEIQFLDDNLTSNKKMAKKLFRRLKDYDLSLCFPHGLMTKTMDKEMIELIADAGGYQISIAIESASPRVLKEIIDKPVPEKKIVKSLVDICHDNDIQVHGLFIVGLIGERKEEIFQTLDYPFEVGFDSASFFIANPLPGSRLYSECEEKGYLKKDIKSFDVKHSEIIIPKNSPDYVMSNEELEKNRK